MSQGIRGTSKSSSIIFMVTNFLPNRKNDFSTRNFYINQCCCQKISWKGHLLFFYSFRNVISAYDPFIHEFLTRHIFFIAMIMVTTMVHDAETYNIIRYTWFLLHSSFLIFKNCLINKLQYRSSIYNKYYTQLNLYKN